MLQIDTEAAKLWLARAITAARASGKLAQLSQSLTTASAAEHMAGDAAAAQRLLGEAEALAPDVHSYSALIGLIQARAISAFFEGDLDTAKAASSQGAQLSREAGDLYYLQIMLQYLGQAAMLTGDVATSEPRFVEALSIARQIDDRITQYVLLSLLSWHAASTERPRIAAQLLGAAEALGSGTGAGITGPAMPHLARANKAAASALGAAKFEVEYATGRSMGRQAALRLALKEVEHVDADPFAFLTTGPLAKREADVARLVAEGLTNKQIGTRLFISDRTVATHVRNIMNKLGFDSRAQIASWMAASGP